MNRRSESSSSARLCPSCRRRVPQWMITCPCGDRPSEEKIVFREPPRAPSVRRVPARPWLALAVLVGLALGILLIMLPTRASTPAAKPKAAAPSRETPDAPVDAEVPPSVASETSPEPPVGAEVGETEPPVGPVVGEAEPDQPVVADASDKEPAALPIERPLDQIVAEVLPAVVSIQTDQGRRGSGFFVAPRRIITSYHVVEGNTRVAVKLASGRLQPASIASIDAGKDLALLEVETSVTDYAVLPLGSANDVRPGQEVVAVGSALGLQSTVTRGIVSAVRTNGTLTLVQTDAAMNQGNSGGPLVNRAGQVIGVNTMTLRPAQSIGFAVAADHARALLLGGGTRPDPVASVPFDRTPSKNGPPRMSSRKKALDEAAQRFDGVMQKLAPRVLNLKSSIRSFETSCLGGSWSEREGAWRGPLMASESGRGFCSQSYQNALRESERIQRLVDGAEAQALEAGVYAPVLRQTRQRYGISW